MPFRSGSLSARRFVVQGDVSATFDRTATMALRRYAWKPINDERAEKESFGWIDPRHPLAEAITWEDLQDGPLIFLSVRRDRKSFSKVLFLARLQERIEQVQKEKGLSRLTRQHRLALQEELTVVMLKETSATSIFTELVWDRNTNEVYMTATSTTLCERISELFMSTFELKLVPQFPALKGYAALCEQGLEEGFDAATAALGAEDAQPTAAKPTAAKPNGAKPAAMPAANPLAALADPSTDSDNTDGEEN
ncbi:MAG: recombination-associated protein RdgC [Sumerlaeia bacterium]